MLRELDYSVQSSSGHSRLFYYALWTKLMEFTGGMFILFCVANILLAAILTGLGIRAPRANGSKERNLNGGEK